MADKLIYGLGTDTSIVTLNDSTDGNALERSGYRKHMTTPFQMLFECLICSAIIVDPKKHRKCCNENRY